MTYETMMAMLAPFLVIALIWGLIGLAFFIWYLAAMARLFPLIGLPAGHGWIPLWNDWRLIARAGLPGWVAILYLVPGANIVAVVFRTIAQHRIGREVGVGAGYTVLGLVLPPLWATLIGSIIGPQGLRPPSAPFASGFGAAPFTGGFGAGPAVPGAAAGSPGSAVPGFPGALPGTAQPPAAPVFSQSTAFEVPVAPQSPAAPDPWASPAQAGSVVPPVTAAPVAAPAPAAPSAPLPAGPLGSETEAEYARLAAEPFQAPPAVPLGQAAAAEPFSWTAASQPTPEPVAAPVVLPPPVHPLAAQPAPEAAPPVTPTPAVAEAAAAPVAPPSAPRPARMSEPPPAPVPAAYNPTGITDSYERLVAEDDLDRTVVVPRAKRVGWVIELPGGERFDLPAFDVIVGRRPEAQGDAQPLAIPDPTRTLSKTHARLRFDGDQWTVEDLGSTNGVMLLLDGEREEELTAYRPAPATDRLLLGTLELRLSRSDETV
ncbi:MAG: FHA domain-containing protein [Leucobacter sp.]